MDTNKEFEAMRSILKKYEGLDVEARQRVKAWVNAKLLSLEIQSDRRAFPDPEADREPEFLQSESLPYNVSLNPKKVAEFHNMGDAAADGAAEWQGLAQNAGAANNE